MSQTRPYLICQVVFMLFSILTKYFGRFRCVISTLTKMSNFYGSFFFTLISSGNVTMHFVKGNTSSDYTEWDESPPP